MAGLHSSQQLESNLHPRRNPQIRSQSQTIML
jgi:hypothetical protein